MKQFVVPVTGCSPWDDFVALRCQAGQQACYNTTLVDLLDHHAPLDCYGETASQERASAP